MSRAEKLFEAIGLVDDAYIEEAADAHAVRSASQWQRWGALAATLVVVAGLGLASVTQLRGCGSKTSNAEWAADSAAPENGSMQESTTTDSAADNSAAGDSMTGGGSFNTEESTTDGGATSGDTESSELPVDSIGAEVMPLTLPDGAWTVDRHTAVEVSETVTVTDTYLVTNDGDTVQEVETQSVEPGQTVEIEQEMTSQGILIVLRPVEAVTPGTWTVEVTAADGYAVEGLTEGELTWENHAFVVLQP